MLKVKYHFTDTAFVRFKCNNEFPFLCPHLRRFQRYYTSLQFQSLPGGNQQRKHRFRNITDDTCSNTPLKYRLHRDSCKMCLPILDSYVGHGKLREVLGIDSCGTKFRGPDTRFNCRFGSTSKVTQWCHVQYQTPLIWQSNSSSPGIILGQFMPVHVLSWEYPGVPELH